MGHRVAAPLHKEMECILHELSALYPIKTLLEMYELAVNDQDYSFWYVNMSARKKEDMFYIRFEEKMVLE